MTDPIVKLRNAYQQALSAVSSIYSEPEATSLIELVFRHILNCSRFELHRRFDTNLLISQQIQLNEIIIELQKHKPLQYILGETEFYGLTFKVGAGTLIPRPETEELVEWILSENRNFPSLKVIDIGTGSGCIPVVLAKNLNSPIIEAIDVSEDALRFAKENSRLNNCNINFRKQDILTTTFSEAPQYDIIISNPPYIPEHDRIFMASNVLDFEPGLALFVPDKEPLVFYRKILEFALLAGKPGAKVYFEIHENYGNEIRQMFSVKGFENITIRKDLNGKVRMASGHLPLAP